MNCKDFSLYYISYKNQPRILAEHKLNVSAQNDMAKFKTKLDCIKEFILRSGATVSPRSPLDALNGH